MSEKKYEKPKKILMTRNRISRKIIFIGATGLFYKLVTSMREFDLIRNASLLGKKFEI
jgi:hypothetical protein